MFARVIEFNKLTPESHGWYSHDEINWIAFGVKEIPEQFLNQEIIDEYLFAWEEMLIDMFAAELLVNSQYVALSDETSYVTVMAFETQPELTKCIDGISDVASQKRFIAARAALAALWGMEIKIHECVELEKLEDLQIDEVRKLLK